MIQMLRYQQGATLIVTMIFLVLLTFLGVSTIQDTALEEKMAANMRFKNMVFQDAETALREAEELLSQPAPLSVDANDWLYDDGYPFGVFDSCASTGASWASASASNATVKSWYVAQELSVLGTSDSAEVGVAQDEQKLYRITACARSDNTSALVVLQSTFSR
ncbi:PilX N-terminal domain-containing pilus assembly protein [Motiliproteus sp. SC1-56]|uniref:pilus assembly PilX family protein n=1 Tax=Motiliproteus sp. SC1-56 TaxID=2799565 RepID=UPI001A8CD253|nr:PilX N-terminal domain-containing pilus assembly protein [Motiliproteus sp. SC1-56]